MLDGIKLDTEKTEIEALGRSGQAARFAVMGSVRRCAGLGLGHRPNTGSCDPFTRNRGSGGRVAKDRLPVSLDFDNWVFMQVRQGNLPTPDLLAEE